MDAWIPSLLSNALVATVLALIVTTLGMVWRNPRMLHVLWILVLLKLVTPPIVTVPIDIPATHAGSSPAAGADAGAVDSFSGDWNGSRVRAADRALGMERPDSERAIPNRESELVWQLPSVSGRTWIVVAWLLSAFGCAALTAYRVLRFRRHLKNGTAANVSIIEQARALCRLMGIHNCPPIVLLAGRVSPVIWPFSRPATIVLPEELFRQLDAPSRETILAHELAHVRRRDHWVRVLELFATALFWWHPVLWWARRQLRELEEQCADSEVVRILPESKQRYAAALVDTVEFLSSGPGSIPIATTGAKPRSPLGKRIVTILKANPSRRRLSVVSAAACLIVFAIVPLGFIAAKPSQDNLGPNAALRDAGPAEEHRRTEPAAALKSEKPTAGVVKSRRNPDSPAIANSTSRDGLVILEKLKVKKLQRGARLPFTNRTLEFTTVPEQLAGLNYGMRNRYRGVARFRVLREQRVFLLMFNKQWGRGGNGSGGWRKEVLSRGDLGANGWMQVAPLHLEDTKRQIVSPWLLFARTCKAGESFVIRNHKYHAPVVIWGKNDDIQLTKE